MTSGRERCHEESEAGGLEMMQVERDLCMPTPALPLTSSGKTYSKGKKNLSVEVT